MLRVGPGLRTVIYSGEPQALAMTRSSPVDAGFEFQQNLSELPLSDVLVRARSNRLEDLEP
jgi:hypothetical protein